MRLRPGMTLVEVLLFMVIFGLMSSVIIEVLFAASENRIRQENVELVEQNALRLTQDVVQAVRGSERVTLPIAGATGSVLALQTSSGATDPTIVALESGGLLLIQHSLSQTLSSPAVAVPDFTVRNTSSGNQQSVTISFTVSRVIPLHIPVTYSRTVTTGVMLFPADAPQGNACGCPAPSCSGDVLQWGSCAAGVCRSVSTAAQC